MDDIRVKETNTEDWVLKCHGCGRMNIQPGCEYFVIDMSEQACSDNCAAYLESMLEDAQ